MVDTFRPPTEQHLLHKVTTSPRTHFCCQHRCLTSSIGMSANLHYHRDTFVQTTAWLHSTFPLILSSNTRNRDSRPHQYWPRRSVQKMLNGGPHKLEGGRNSFRSIHHQITWICHLLVSFVALNDGNGIQNTSVVVLTKLAFNFTDCQHCAPNFGALHPNVFG